MPSIAAASLHGMPSVNNNNGSGLNLFARKGFAQTSLTCGCWVSSANTNSDAYAAQLASS
jgi:hypothetical protein